MKSTSERLDMKSTSGKIGYDNTIQWFTCQGVFDSYLHPVGFLERFAAGTKRPSSRLLVTCPNEIDPINNTDSWAHCIKGFSIF